MPAFAYDKGVNSALSGSLNFASDTLKIILLTGTYSPSKADSAVSTLSAAEISATGYAGGYGGAGRLSASRSVSLDATNHANRVIFASSPTWSALGGASNATVAAAALIKETGGADSSSIPVAFWPLGSTQTGTTTSGSAVVTGLSNTLSISVGMAVSGAGIPGGTTVASIQSATQVTLSANATASGSPSLTFGTPFTTNGSGFTLTIDAVNGNVIFNE